MRLTLLFSLFLITACAPVAPPTPDPAPPPRSSDMAPRNAEEQAEAAACPARGGHLDRIGKLQALRCIITYADAGKACTDGAQCLGQRCAGEPGAEGPATGRCVATNDPFGCNVIVRDGQAATICVD